jgi:hypothetical protein
MTEFAILFVFVIAPILLAILFGILWRRVARMLVSTQNELSGLRARFAGIIDADEDEKRVRTQIIELTTETEALRASYREKKQVHDRLLAEIAVFDEKLSFAELGVYEPHFDFSDSEAYREKILMVRERQKAMVSAKTAVIAETEWTVDGSKAKGQTMMNRAIRLTLRAFNNECEAAVANVRWNNVIAMEKRIARACEQIDNLNASNRVVIAHEYAGLKL